MLLLRDRLTNCDVGITVHSWQLHWGPATLDRWPAHLALRSAASRSAMPPRRPDDLLRATDERLVPGDGVADLAGLVRTLDRIGYSGPITVEAINAELIARHDPVALARILGDAARAVIARARHEPDDHDDFDDQPLADKELEHG